MNTAPFTSGGLIESEDRSARLVVEANPSHWNHERGPRLQRVVFRNDLTPAQALELCISTEGEMDIVTEVSPADAARVLHSLYAKLVRSEEHTSELQSQSNLVCRLLLEKKNISRHQAACAAMSLLAVQNLSLSYGYLYAGPSLSLPLPQDPWFLLLSAHAALIPIIRRAT